MEASHQGHSIVPTDSNKSLEIDLINLFQSETEGISVRELSDKTGKSVNQIRHKLRQLVQQGQVQMVGYKMLSGILDNRQYQVPAYRLVEEK